MSCWKQCRLILSVAEKQLVIKAKNEELQLAEAVENETGKMARMQDLQNQWNNGMLLAKDGRYEEAIAVFTNLHGYRILRQS